MLGSEETRCLCIVMTVEAKNGGCMGAGRQDAKLDEPVQVPIER